MRSVSAGHAGVAGSISHTRALTEIMYGHQPTTVAKEEHKAAGEAAKNEERGPMGSAAGRANGTPRALVFGPRIVTE
eukprot:10699219-Heterocapsa_arctica.AAC.1